MSVSCFAGQTSVPAVSFSLLFTISTLVYSAFVVRCPLMWPVGSVSTSELVPPQAVPCCAAHHPKSRRARHLWPSFNGTASASENFLVVGCPVGWLWCTFLWWYPCSLGLDWSGFSVYPPPLPAPLQWNAVGQTLSSPNSGLLGCMFFWRNDSPHGLLCSCAPAFHSTPTRRTWQLFTRVPRVSGLG